MKTTVTHSNAKVGQKIKFLTARAKRAKSGVITRVLKTKYEIRDSRGDLYDAKYGDEDIWIEDSAPKPKKTKAPSTRPAITSKPVKAADSKRAALKKAKAATKKAKAPSVRPAIQSTPSRRTRITKAQREASEQRQQERFRAAKERAAKLPTGKYWYYGDELLFVGRKIRSRNAILIAQFGDPIIVHEWVAQRGQVFAHVGAASGTAKEKAARLFVNEENRYRSAEPRFSKKKLKLPEGRIIREQVEAFQAQLGEEWAIRQEERDARRGKI
jgi:hypothetical protein